MRRLAAAVLAAVVNLLASMDSDALVVGDDDPGDGFGDVEWQPSASRESHRAAGRRAATPNAFGAPIDGAWAVRLPTGQAAAVGVRHRDDFVAIVGLRVIAGCPGWDDLMSRAVASAQDHGALKLVVESEGVPAESVRSLAEARGFQFSRALRLEWVDVLEFYTDLYRRGHPADGATTG